MNLRTALLLVTLGAAPLPGQIISPTVPRPPNPWISPIAPRRMPGIDPIYRSGFQGLRSITPQFQGFPTFPTDDQGYGGFPRPPAALTLLPENLEGRLPPPAPPTSPDWPSWVRLELEAGTGAFAPSRAILIRGSDQIWFLDPEEPAFLPLAYYDTVRVVENGSQIQVRDKGEFELIFHGGTRLESHGPIDLSVRELSEQRIDLRLERLTNVRIDCRAHPTVITLPDGSTLEINLEDQGTDVGLQRELSRIYVQNWGPGPLTLRGPLHPDGVAVPPDHRVTVWTGLVPENALRPDLQLEGAVFSNVVGRRLEVAAEAGGGAVIWSGARIRIPAGGSLTLDPLSGTTFPVGGDRNR